MTMARPAWGLLALYLVILLLWGGQPDGRGQLVAAMGIVLAGGIGAAALGLRGALLFLASALLVTLGIENIGVATGFPFGSYHFEASRFSLWIGRVPLLVGMLYFGVGVLSWLIAGVLDRRGDVISRPIMAAALMVQWDLVMDPGFSTIGRVWVWHQGGAFFGVPLRNFAGWFVTTWIMFQLFALAARRMPQLVRAPRQDRLRDLQLAAILLYLGIGLTPVMPFLTRPDAVVVDGGRAGVADACDTGRQHVAGPLHHGLCKPDCLAQAAGWSRDVMFEASLSIGGTGMLAEASR
jgi:uncharacterized membrane protein